MYDFKDLYIKETYKSLVSENKYSTNYRIRLEFQKQRISIQILYETPLKGQP